jgi:hypothetical protein
MAITDSGGVGPKMFQQLLMRLGAPEDFLSATYTDFEEIPRLSNERTRRLLDSLEKVDIYEKKLREYSSLGINIVTYLDSELMILPRYYISKESKTLFPKNISPWSAPRGPHKMESVSRWICQKNSPTGDSE